MFTVGLGNRRQVEAMGKNPFTGETVFKWNRRTWMKPRCGKSRKRPAAKFYRAENSERLRQIYAEINRLEKTEAVVNKFTQYTELFPWVVTRVGLLLLEIVLGQTWIRKLP